MHATIVSEWRDNANPAELSAERLADVFAGDACGHLIGWRWVAWDIAGDACGHPMGWWWRWVAHGVGCDA